MSHDHYDEHVTAIREAWELLRAAIPVVANRWEKAYLEPEGPEGNPGASGEA